MLASIYLTYEQYLCRVLSLSGSCNCNGPKTKLKLKESPFNSIMWMWSAVDIVIISVAGGTHERRTSFWKANHLNFIHEEIQTWKSKSGACFLIGFRCNYPESGCGKRFPSTGSLWYHKRMHSNDKTNTINSIPIQFHKSQSKIIFLLISLNPPRTININLNHHTLQQTMICSIFPIPIYLKNSAFKILMRDHHVSGYIS